MEPFVTAVIPSHLARAAASMGVDARELDAICPLPPDRWFQFEQRVPLADAARLAAHCARLLGRDFGLRAVNAPGEQYSTLWFLAAARPTLADAIDTANHYWPLVRSDYRWRTEVSERHLTSIAEIGPDDIGDDLGRAILLDFDIASLCASGEVFTGQPFRALEVCLPFPPPRDPRPWLALAEEVRFDWPRAEIRIARADSHRPMIGHNPVLANFLETKLDAMLDRHPSTRLWSARVRQVLRRALPSGDVDRATIARQLGTSERTLLRRLAADGVSYRQLLDDVRFEIAARQLTELPVAEVARRLGYADVRAFRRAFRRWSGQSPAGWRERSPSADEPTAGPATGEG